MEAMLQYEESPVTILRSPLSHERTCRPTDATGRIIAEEILSSIDLPPSIIPAMDGYRCSRFRCCFSKPDSPVALSFGGANRRGENFSGEVTQVPAFVFLPAHHFAWWCGCSCDAGRTQRSKLQPPKEIQILDPVKPWETSLSWRGR